MASPTDIIYPFTAGNIEWQLVIKKLGGTDEYDIVIIEVKCLYENRNDFWSCTAEFEVILNWKKRHSMTHCFSSFAKRVRFRKPFQLKIFKENEKQMYKFGLRIITKSTSGQGIFELSDFSIPAKNSGSEVVLRLKKRRFYVDKYLLMSFSSVFRGILLSNDDTNEIEIENVSCDDFLHFLQILHGQVQPISTRNVNGLIAIGKQYNIQFLLADCEDFLISSNDLVTLEKLRLAELHKFSKLQINALQKLTKYDVDIKKYFRDMNCPTFQAILERKSEISEKERNAFSIFSATVALCGYVVLGVCFAK